LEALLARDKVNLDIFWVKDHALDDPDLLPPPDEVAAEKSSKVWRRRSTASAT
jgi:type I restriction enzyme M protein